SWMVVFGPKYLVGRVTVAPVWGPYCAPRLPCPTVDYLVGVCVPDRCFSAARLDLLEAGALCLRTQPEANRLVHDVEGILRTTVLLDRVQEVDIRAGVAASNLLEKFLAGELA